MTTQTTDLITLNHPLRIYVPVPSGAPGAAPALPPGAHGLAARAPAARAGFDTLGWDTVFAVPVSEINRRFAESLLYPTDFAATLVGALATTQIAGNFGPWEITTGGAGALVRLQIPIASGLMTASEQSFDLAGGQIIVEVKLSYLPQPPEGDAGTPHQLRVNTKATELSAVRVIEITLPGETDATVIALAHAVFEQWFTDNVDRITAVFATVNLNAVAAAGAFQWLKPTYTSYAYYDAASVEQAVFGVLCMVNDNPPGTNTNLLGPGAIPVGAQSAFSISSDRFMDQMMLPAVVSAFDASSHSGVDSSYFKVASGGTAIENTKNIRLKHVEWGGISYQPKCTNVTVTLQVDRLVVYSLTHVNISDGIDSYVEQTSYFKVGITTDEQGNQYLDFVESEPASTRTWTDIADWIVITVATLGIITAVGGVLTALLSKVAWAVAVGIAIALAAGLAVLTPELIALVQAEGVAGNVPSLDGIVLDATDGVKWMGGEEFELTDVQLNGALQLGGNAFPAG